MIVYISVEICNIKGRKLYMDDSRRWGFIHNYESQINSYKFKNIFSKTDLISNSRNIAANISIEQFKRFGWDINFDHIKELQNDFVKA